MNRVDLPRVTKNLLNSEQSRKFDLIMQSSEALSSGQAPCNYACQGILPQQQQQQPGIVCMLNAEQRMTLLESEARHRLEYVREGLLRDAQKSDTITAPSSLHIGLQQQRSALESPWLHAANLASARNDHLQRSILMSELNALHRASAFNEALRTGDLEAALRFGNTSNDAMNNPSLLEHHHQVSLSQQNANVFPPPMQVASLHQNIASTSDVPLWLQGQQAILATTLAPVPFPSEPFRTSNIAQSFPLKRKEELTSFEEKELAMNRKKQRCISAGNSFALPSLKNKKNNLSCELLSYHKIWLKLEKSEMSDELFRRRLHKADIPLLGKTKSVILQNERLGGSLTGSICD
jgi:hypothetical protein